MKKIKNILVKKPSHTFAIIIALFVTLLWSTSFILIKWGLYEIPPLTFAGLRYSLAFFVLIPFALNSSTLIEIKNLQKNDWRNLFLLGVLFYSITQGAQFVGLYFLPAVTVSLILNFTPVIVAFFGIWFLRENLSLLKWLGTLLFLIGVMVYFIPINFLASKTIGLIVMSLGVIANASSSVLGRKINRDGKLSPLTITIVSMGFGSTIMLFVGLLFQGLDGISFNNILLLLWLSIINTALAFTLWNLSLKTLTAMESTIINGTMLIQIAILSYFFLGEVITLQEGIGMTIAAVGALLVQIKWKNK